MRNGSYRDPREIDPLWTDRRVSACAVAVGWAVSGFFILGLTLASALLS